MSATAERNAAPRSIPSELWEMGLSTLETVAWAQDQADTLTRSMLDQARTLRHDSHKVVEKLATQAKANHEEMSRLVEEGVKNALQFVPGWDALTGEDLRRQVADLSARVDALSNR